METERKIPVLTLIRHNHMLQHLQSFSEPVEMANFSVSMIKGIKTGKSYVGARGEMAKTAIRGVVVLDMYHVIRDDAVVLTKDQYEDVVALLAPGSR